ncbi:MAG: hypothetical protein COS34_10430, partial [Lysobacterales bacterium CG02_land_8_20_14_3_00_62_12]
MAVDYAKVQQDALKLKSELARFAPVDPEAAALERTLTPWIDAVLNGSAKLPFKEVPCGWYFVGGKVAEAEFDALSKAYCSFAIHAEGKDSEETELLFHRLETDPKFAARMNSNELVWWEKIWDFFS